MRRLKTGRRPPIYPKTPGHLPCSSLTHPLPLPSRRPSVSFGGFGLNPTGYANTVRAMIESVFPTECLSEITAPTLIIAGELGPAHAAAHLTHTKIQGSEFVVIPGAGHVSNLDSPDEFNSCVLEFLERVEAGARA